jgi:hypothetical protein
VISTRDQYRLYLQSDEWKTLRNAALVRDGHRCRLCDSSHRLEVHHRRYRVPWSRGTVQDLTVLCRGCHQAVSTRRWLLRLAAALIGLQLLQLVVVLAALASAP